MTFEPTRQEVSYTCAVLLIGGRAGPFYRFTDSWSLTSLLRVGHRVATLLDSTRESDTRPALQFLAKVRRAGRGKPMQISSFTLFHAKCGTERVGIAFLAVSLRVAAENVVTDRQTQTKYRTLAAHARRGLAVTLVRMRIVLVYFTASVQQTKGQGQLATATEHYKRRQLDRYRRRLVRQRETQVGSSERLARFTIERWITFFSAHHLQFLVNAQVPASNGVCARHHICGYVYLVLLYLCTPRGVGDPAIRRGLM